MRTDDKRRSGGWRGQRGRASVRSTLVVRAAFIATLTALLSCGGSDDDCCVLPPPGNGSALSITTVAGGFDTIWEIAWGPDGFLWITERPGTISRVNPTSGSVARAGAVAVSEIGEGGLMGLAFHPDFATQPWVYAGAYLQRRCRGAQSRGAHAMDRDGPRGPGDHPRRHSREFDPQRRARGRRSRPPALRHLG